VVPQNSAALELAAELGARLTAFLKEQLPEYMVPPSFSVLARLPTSAVGKLERSALPAPALTALAARPLYEAPAFEIERVIISVWQEVLGCEGIGVRDNFFDLGGHSLRLAEVQSQLQAALLREVPMMDLFRYPTVRELAVHLSGVTAATPAPGAAASGPLSTPSRERAQRQRSALNRPIISRRRGPRHD
jgi:acyl carrier protein